MRRRSLAQRSLRQLALVRNLHARQVLSARLSVYEQLPELLGLHAEALEQERLPVPEPPGVTHRELQAVSGLLIPAVDLDDGKEPGDMPMADEAPVESDEYEQEIAPVKNKGTTDLYPSGETRVGAQFIAPSPDIGDPQGIDQPPRVGQSPGIGHPQGRNSLRPYTIAPNQEQPLAYEVNPEEEIDSSAYNESVVSGEVGEELRQEARRGLPNEEEQQLAEPSPPAKSAQQARPVTPRRAKGHIEERHPSAGNAPARSPIEAAGDSREYSRTTRARGRPEAPAATPQSSEGTSLGDDLFQPVDTDRSPQAWLERLQRAARATSVGENAQPARAKVAGTAPTDSSKSLAAPRAVRQEMQLSQQAQRFLQPLVGIDPASVPIYADALAEQRTEAAYADALTGVDAIELAPTQQDNSPRALGVLAHELTHMARQREPRFIPPIALPGNAASIGSRPTSHLQEERLAELVEGRVRQAAQQRAEAAAPALPTVEDGEDAQSIRAYPMGETESGRTMEVQEAAPVATERREQGFWGGLPAPWEPLPGWLTAQPSNGEQEPAMANGAAQLVQPVQAAPPVLSAGQQAGESPGGFAGVQRAGRERSVVEEEPPQGDAAPASQHQQAGALEPDLDALARQVYSILKRRLGVENRREG